MLRTNCFEEVVGHTLIRSHDVNAYPILAKVKVLEKSVTRFQENFKRIDFNRNDFDNLGTVPPLPDILIDNNEIINQELMDKEKTSVEKESSSSARTDVTEEKLLQSNDDKRVKFKLETDISKEDVSLVEVNSENDLEKLYEDINTIRQTINRLVISSLNKRIPKEELNEIVKDENNIPAVNESGIDNREDKTSSFNNDATHSNLIPGIVQSKVRFQDENLPYKNNRNPINNVSAAYEVPKEQLKQNNKVTNDAVMSPRISATNSNHNENNSQLIPHCSTNSNDITDRSLAPTNDTSPANDSSTQPSSHIEFDAEELEFRTKVQQALPFKRAVERLNTNKSFRKTLPTIIEIPEDDSPPEQ